MSVKRSIIISVGLILCLASHLPLKAQEAKSVKQTSEIKRGDLPLFNYLKNICEKYDCFFTVENGWGEGEAIDSLGAHWVEKSRDLKGLEEELERLRQAVPNFQYLINTHNRRIVHILDARLPRQEGYGLEGMIQAIDFRGLVKDLPSEIGKRGLAVQARQFMFTHETMDRTTSVTVKGEGLKVRDALSNFIPLEGRQARVLWIASTKIGSQQVSDVLYP